MEGGHLSSYTMASLIILDRVITCLSREGSVFCSKFCIFTISSLILMNHHFIDFLCFSLYTYWLIIQGPEHCHRLCSKLPASTIDSKTKVLINLISLFNFFLEIVKEFSRILILYFFCLFGDSVGCSIKWHPETKP